MMRRVRPYFSAAAVAAASVLFLCAVEPLAAQNDKKADEIINTILDGAQPGVDTSRSDPTRRDSGKAEPSPQPTGGERKTAPDGLAAERKEGKAAINREEEALYRTGVDFFYGGMYDHAAEKFRELLSKFPQGTFRDAAHFWLGKLALKRYRYKEAIAEFSSVSAESGDYPASHYFTAEAYRMNGDVASAMEYYQRMAARFPAHELADDALLDLARLYAARRMGTQAVETALQILKYYKDRETVDEAFYVVATVYEQDPKIKDPDTARRLLRQFLKRAESDERFRTSPVKKRVEEDLRRIEAAYFRMDQ